MVHDEGSLDLITNLWCSLSPAILNERGRRIQAKMIEQNPQLVVVKLCPRGHQLTKADCLGNGSYYCQHCLDIVN